MISGEPSGFFAGLCETCPIVKSWMLLPVPMTIRFTSPRSTVLHQTELSRPIVTSPITCAESWMNTRSATSGEVER